MKRFAVILLLVLSPQAGCQSKGGQSGDASAGSSSAGGNEDLQKVVNGLLDQHTQGLLKHDYASLERLWADDFTFINYRGELLTKANRLANVKSGATKFDAIEVFEHVVRPLGNDAAVSTCRVNIKGQYSGQEGSGPYRVTFAWARRGANWQLVALQMTRIGS